MREGLSLSMGMGIPSTETGLPHSSRLGHAEDALISILFPSPTVASVKENNCSILVMVKLATTTTTITTTTGTVPPGGTKIVTKKSCKRIYSALIALNYIMLPVYGGLDINTLEQ